ncbi:hypothetical protein HNR46_001047 [Haloferula luteola]|uniref:Uncharacterized protein n=1 Tax=Haloferula luteola TaxID=595692 RepID=A0A840V0H8_9BACT|nr:hypothetical protein [Haloferula luteola]MBB5350813.1 hypothetical protein [Haloferula luteola]
MQVPPATKNLFSTLRECGWIPLVALGVVALYWSPAPFWIDASGYTVAVEKGGAVVHPPGYIGFLQVAHWFHAMGLTSYHSVQAISLLSYLAAIPIHYAACRRHTTRAFATVLTLMFAFSWVSLNIASVGTTHASDLLFGAVIAWLLSLPGRADHRGWWYPLLVGTMLAIAAFRMSTLVMFAPMVIALVLLDFRRRSLWISGIVGALLLAGILLATANAYGGMDAFRAATAELNATNRQAGILTGGSLRSSASNLLRALFWLIMAAPLLPVWMAARLGTLPKRLADSTNLLIGLAIGGCLVVNFGYLCTHPGYFAPLLSLSFVLTARWISPTPLLGKSGAAQIGFVALLFFLARPLPSQGSAPLATLNAWLLQYSASTQRHAIPIRTLSEWLMDSGLTELVPDYRVEKVISDREKAQAD